MFHLGLFLPVKSSKLITQQQQQRFLHSRTKLLEIILLKDIPNLGLKGQCAYVKRGYMRNYLYPERMAIYATNDNKNKYYNKTLGYANNINGRKERNEDDIHSLKNILSNFIIKTWRSPNNLKKKSNDKSTLYDGRIEGELFSYQLP